MNDELAKTLAELVAVAARGRVGAAQLEADTALLTTGVALDSVEVLELVFLGNLTDAQPAGRGIALETRDWLADWAPDTSTPDAELTPPAALEFRLQLEDLGEMRRIYALPPL